MSEGHDVLLVSPVKTDIVPSLSVPHPFPEAPHGAGENRQTFRSRLREWLLLPDADIKWALRVGRVALPFTPDWIVTTSPPESIHAAGLLLKKRTGARWLADLRDHWLTEPLLAIRRRSRIRRWIETALARLILSRANAISAVTNGIGEEAARYCPNLPADRIATTENYHPLRPCPRAPKSDSANETRVILHTGSFSLSDPNRGIGPVISSFEKIHQPGLRLRLVGKLTQSEIAAVKASPHASSIETVGPLPLEKSWAEQQNADYLLLAISDGTPHIPGKLAEYVSTRRPIYLVGTSDWTSRFDLLPLSLYPKQPPISTPPATGTHGFSKIIGQLEKP